MFKLENDIMMEMERRRAVPAASEAAPREEYLAPDTANERIFPNKAVWRGAEGYLRAAEISRGQEIWISFPSPLLL